MPRVGALATSPQYAIVVECTMSKMVCDAASVEWRDAGYGQRARSLAGIGDDKRLV